MDKHSAIRSRQSDESHCVDLYLHDRQPGRSSLDMLANALATTTNSHTPDWRVGYADSGRPIIDRYPPGVAPPGISMSHSGRIAVIAVSSTSAVGVDVEIMRERRYRGIAEYLDWPAIIGKLPAKPSPDQFFHLWTLWEACIKATPDGWLLRPTEAFRALAPLIDTGRPAHVASDAWYAASWVLPEQYWLTVVTDSPGPTDIRIVAADRTNEFIHELLGPDRTNPDGMFPGAGACASIGDEELL